MTPRSSHQPQGQPTIVIRTEDGDTEYIRADLHEAQVAELGAANALLQAMIDNNDARIAELETLTDNLRTAADAWRDAGLRAESRITELEAALQECADDLEAEVNAKYPGNSLDYPTMARRYIADMEPVKTARRLLSPTA